MSSFNSLFKRASNLLGGLTINGNNAHNDLFRLPPCEGEVIFCKNNVCVHPINSQMTNVNHHPGYLTIKGHTDEVHNSNTLILSWIPNSTLKTNPRSVENKSVSSSPCRSSRSSACPSPRRTSPRHSVISDSIPSGCTSPRPTSVSSEKSPDDYSFSHSMFKPISSSNDKKDTQSISSTASDIGSPCDEECLNLTSLDSSWTNSENDQGIFSGQGATVQSNGSCNSSKKPKSAIESQTDSGIGPEEVSAALESMICGLNDFGNVTAFSKSNLCMPKSISTTVQNETIPQSNPELYSTTTTSFDDSDNSPCSTPSKNENLVSAKYSTPFDMEGTPESLAHAHNLNFPEINGGSSSGYPSARHSTFENTCGVFSVDLAQMRSLRLFYSNPEQTCGQLVIASRESRYKILHFHYGGLDKLAQVFGDWSFLLKIGHGKFVDENEPYSHFSICQPIVEKKELHPDDSLYKLVDEEVWKSFMNDNGQILDNFQLRKNIFFGGLDPAIRNDTWSFLLHYYSFESTFNERDEIRNDRYLEYQNIRKKRETMSLPDKEVFYRNIQCIVDKDVVRTDCTNPFFSGSDNPNVEVMRNILLNYAVYNPTMGYTQGMSDLLAPILMEIQEEAMAFWCFVGLMQRTLFVSSPRDQEMDIHLKYLRELIRVLVPDFYGHLNKYDDAKELLFCHRWILLCFKREFKDTEALKIWEACWSHYQTDYFHMFICVAIICIYGEDIIHQNLPPDEMLLHFSSLALHMDGNLVLSKARGLLHQFRLSPKIPCSLHGLCEMNESSMWDTGQIQTQIECICRQSVLQTCPVTQKSGLKS
ncbi:TBC1 domain family member 16 [Nymphon striatum]|nr:TBC1 domain family member 16 [Nymphon striatum]